MSSRTPRVPSVLEPLETRRLFCGDGLQGPPTGDGGGGDSGGGDGGITTGHLPVLNAKSFAGRTTDAAGSSTRLNIKFANRGASTLARTGSTSLGTMSIVSANFGTLRATVRSGTMLRDRTLRLNFSGSGFRGTFTGRTNADGTLLQGKVTVTGSVQFATSTLKLAKV